MNNNIDKLRSSLFDMLDRLLDKNCDIKQESQRAISMVEISKQIIDTGKLEVDLIKVLGENTQPIFFKNTSIDIQKSIDSLPVINPRQITVDNPVINALKLFGMPMDKTLLFEDCSDIKKSQFDKMLKECLDTKSVISMKFDIEEEYYFLSTWIDEQGREILNDEMYEYLANLEVIKK